MSVVINTNYAATVAGNNLSASSTSLQRSLNRLSSGSKIVAPSDDAGGLAVSMKLSAAAKRMGAQIANNGNRISQLQTQDGALKVAGKVLERMSELTALAADVTKDASDLSNYDSEFQTLKSQLTTIGSETFNGTNMFGTEYSTTAIGGLSASVVTSGGAAAANTAVQTSIKEVAKLRAVNGASQSNLGFQTELTTINKANLEAANSRIVDVDVAEESTQLARWNILVQSGTAMLAQANQSASSAMRLLQ